MEFRELQLFVDVVRLGSFTRAAERGFVTQPAVSAAIRRLETELGVRLLDRDRSGVRPTPDGRRFFAHATTLLRARDAARSDLSGDGEIGGVLHLGTTDAVSAYLFPDVFRDFRKRHPAVALHVRVDSSRTLAEAVVGLRLDLAVLNLPATVDGLETLPVVDESLVLVAAPGHPAVERRTRRRQLAEAPFIAYPAESVTRRVVDESLRRVGVEPRIEMEMGSPDAMRQLVAVGIGVSALPKALVADAVSDRRLVEIPIRGFRARRRLGFAYASSVGLTPAARAFIDATENRFRGRAKSR